MNDCILCVHVPVGRGVIAWQCLCVSVFAKVVTTLGCVCVCYADVGRLSKTLHMD